MTLYDYAEVIRSKNAGPFTLTIDLMFNGVARFTKAFDFLSAKKSVIAGLYNVREEDVLVYRLTNANTVKITLPRPISSGGLNDLDVYGSQQHFPLADMKIEELV